VLLDSRWVATSDRWLAKQAGVRNLVLTHFSLRYQDGGAMPISLIEDDARAEYSGKLIAARDLDHYSLSRSGLLEHAT
jgi:ribonuclease Z